jgi:hypothetical protein
MPFGSKSVSQFNPDSILYSETKVLFAKSSLNHRRTEIAHFQDDFLVQFILGIWKKHIEVLKITVQSRVHTRRKHHPEVNVLLAKPRREAWVIKFRWQLLVFDEIIFVYFSHDIDINITSSQIAFKKILMLSLKATRSSIKCCKPSLISDLLGNIAM